MARARGANAVMAAVFEATYGVTPGTGFRKCGGTKSGEKAAPGRPTPFVGPRAKDLQGVSASNATCRERCEAAWCGHLLASAHPGQRA